MEKGILQGNNKTWQLASSFVFQKEKIKKPDHTTSLWKSVNTGKSGRLFLTMVADYKTDLV